MPGRGVAPHAWWRQEIEHPKHKQLHRCSQRTARVVCDEPSPLESSRLEIVSGLNPRETDLTGVSGGPVKSAGGNVGGNPVSVKELVPGGLQLSYLELN